MSDAWPAGVPETLWNYQAHRLGDAPGVPMMGVSLAAPFIYAFSFGMVFVMVVAWQRFRKTPGGNQGFGYKVIDEIDVGHLGGTNAMHRAYLIYAASLLAIYVSMTFFGKLILQALDTLPLVGAQVDTHTLDFTSPQWPLTLAFGLAGVAPMLPPLRIAEDWLRLRAYRAVGIPVRIRQTTHALIATLNRHSDKPRPAKRKDDVLTFVLSERAEPFAKALRASPLGRDRRDSELEEVTGLCAQTDLLAGWARGLRGGWPAVAAPEVRKVEKSVAQDAERQLSQFLKRLREATPPLPREADADFEATVQKLRELRGELTAVLAIYSEHDPIFLNPDGAVDVKNGMRPELAQLLKETDPPDALGSGPEFSILFSMLPVFLLYAVGAFQGAHPLVVPGAAPTDPIAILITAWIETLRVAAIIWLPLLAAFSLRQFMAEGGTWEWDPRHRSAWMEQRLAIVAVAVTVAVVALVGVACLRAFAMAESRGHFVSLLMSGRLPFILFYPSMAVASLPVIFSALAGADQRARGRPAYWRGVRCALGTVVLLVAHTAAWYHRIDACTPPHLFLTDVLLSGCTKFYGALDFVIYGLLAFLAVAVFGRPGQVAQPEPQGKKQAASSDGAALVASMLLAGAVLAALPVPGFAQSPPERPGQGYAWWPYARLVKIGFRTDVEPFSYEPRVKTEPGGRQYDGYLAELCYDVFAGGPYRIEAVAVSSASDRVAMLKRGDIDVLCDPMTMRFADTKRWQAGIFSPIVFASGISFLKSSSRKSGAPIFVGYVTGTTSEPLAHRACDVNLFNTLSADELSAIPAACAVGRAEERLQLAKEGLDSGGNADGDSLRTAIAASQAAVQRLRDQPPSQLDSDRPYVDELKQRESDVSKALAALNEVVPDAQKAGTGAGSNAILVGAAELTAAEAEKRRKEISGKIGGLLTAFGSPCKPEEPPEGEVAKDDGVNYVVQFRFCAFTTHDELVEWFCRPGKPEGTRVYMGDREIILGKLATWRADNLTSGGCPVEDDNGATDLSYEPYALVTSRNRPEVAEFVQRRIYAFFSNRDFALALFEANFPGKTMSPALAYLFLLNGVDDPSCFKRPTAPGQAGYLPDPTPCAAPEPPIDADKARETPPPDESQQVVQAE